MVSTHSVAVAKKPTNKVIARTILDEGLVWLVECLSPL